MSKRKLKQLIDLNVVDGWDDPRLPTIAGLRRRGYTPRSIRDFCRRIGVTRAIIMLSLRFWKVVSEMIWRPGPLELWEL